MGLNCMVRATLAFHVAMAHRIASVTQGYAVIYDLDGCVGVGSEAGLAPGMRLAIGSHTPTHGGGIATLALVATLGDVTLLRLGLMLGTVALSTQEQYRTARDGTGVMQGHA